MLYNGANGAAYDTKVLGCAAPASGLLVQSYPSNGIQNGDPDGVALVRPDGSVAEFLSYEGTLTAVGGPANGMTSSDIGVREAGTEAPGMSLQRIDGVWTAPQPQTFGSGCPVPDVPQDVVISDVQGPGATSPLVGDLVRFEGVVTADHRTGGFDGLYVQTEGSGGATQAGPSDGIFVFLTGNPANHPDVAIGDKVRVTGVVSEFGGVTEVSIDARADVEVLGPGTLPEAAPLALPLDNAGREALEGMLVAPVGPFTVTEVFNLGSFGELMLHAGDHPALTPTEVAEPGDPARAVVADNALRRILLDDGVTANLFNNDIEPPYLGDEPVRVGDSVTQWAPTVLHFGFNAWRLEPTVPVTAETAAADRTQFDGEDRPAAPKVAGDIKVAGFNVLNYFTTLTSENPNARGADTAAEFDVQESKIVAAINSLDADVVSMSEIENSARLGEPADEALGALVAALNAEAGAGTWDYVRSPANLPPTALQDFISNALIYKPAAVTPHGLAVALGDQSDPGEAFAEAREPIAQTFVPVAGGTPYTVIANHFKSKGSAASLPGDQDSGDGQGASNATRVVQAQALRDFAGALATSTGVSDVLLVGDFNAYRNEDPIDVLRAAGYVDLNASDKLETGKHSYVFSGESGSLDHIFATPSAYERAVDLDLWLVNAVESRAFEYTAGDQGLVDPASPYRSSDHNPEVLGLADGCDRTVTGRRVGPLTESTGVLCLIDAAVVGPVRVSGSASLVVVDSSVVGSVTTTGAGHVLLDGGRVTGPLRVSATAGVVRLTNVTVTGPVSITGSTSSAAAVVSSNTVVGSLACSGNAVTPSNEGVPNAVIGPRTGQCAAL